MCTKLGCITSSHQGGGKWDLSKLGSGATIFVRSNESSVHTSPAIPVECIPPPNLKRHLTEARSLDDWKALFQYYLSQDTGGLDEDAKAELLEFEKRLERQAAHGFGKTPFVKRKTLQVGSPDDLVEKFDSLTLVEINNVLAEGSDDVFKEDLRHQWTVLANYLSDLEKKVDKLQAGLVSLSEGTKSEFEDVDLALFKLRSAVGERFEEQGAAPIFELLQSLSEDVDRLLQGNVQGVLSTKSVRQALELGDDDTSPVVTIARMKEGLEFVFKFVNDWSTRLPGDHLELTIQQIQANLVAIETDLRSLLGSGATAPSVPPPPPPPPTGLFFNPAGGIGGLGGRPPAPPPTVHTRTATGGSDLELRVTELERLVVEFATRLSNSEGALSITKSQLLAAEVHIRELQDQAKTQSVTIDNHLFATYASSSAWLVKNVPDPLGYMFFMDAHTMFAIAYELLTASNGYEDFKLSNEASKSGLKSKYKTSVIASFNTALPSIFGQTTGANALVQDYRVLPAMKTFNDWGHHGSYEGASRSLKDKVREVAQWLKTQTHLFLHGDAKNLAEYMISNTCTGLCEMADWMSREFDILCRRGAKKDDAWLLISQLVRALFKELHNTRQAGRLMQVVGDYTASTAHQKQIFWVSLQGYAHFEIFIKSQFSSDPVLGTELFLFLRNFALLKSDKEELKEAIKKIEHSVKTVAGTADKAMDLARKSGGGKKPGKQGKQEAPQTP